MTRCSDIGFGVGAASESEYRIPTHTGFFRRFSKRFRSRSCSDLEGPATTDNIDITASCGHAPWILRHHRAVVPWPSLPKNENRGGQRM
jgi:hypothetical protein